MKINKFNLKKVTIFTLLLSIIFSCSTIKDLEYTVTQNPLHMKGGDVTLQINGKFVESGLNPKGIAEITPIFFCADGNEIPFVTEIYQGPKAAGNGKIVPKEGLKFSYSSTIPYQKSMAEGEVKVRILFKMGSKEPQEIMSPKIADGTVITSLLVDLDNQVIMTDECNFKRTNSFTKTATINFSKGKHNISSKEMRDVDIKELLNFVKSSMDENSRTAVKSIQINSFASPEGEVDLNNNLAQDRGNSAKKFLDSKFKRMKFNAAKEESFYSVASKGEDWNGFKAEVSKTDHEDKELILRVLQMTSDLNKREKEIRNMAKTYSFLEKKVLPQLRRATITVNYDEIGYSDDELKELVATNPDTLTLEEIIQASLNEDDMNTKLKNFNSAQNLFPNDWRIRNNIGYLLYNMGDIDGAEQSFEKALSITDNGIVSNNVGAVKHVKAKKSSDEIKALFESSNTNESKYNIGLIQIEEGKYEESITSMGDNKSYNYALVNILAEHYDAASDALDNISNGGKSYYLKAIIGARTSNNEMVMENLKAAFENDASLKGYAKKDREFISFFENSDFLSIF
jgi:tetratricopeptide (TPR) repeat protein